MAVLVVRDGMRPVDIDVFQTDGQYTVLMQMDEVDREDPDLSAARPVEVTDGRPAHEMMTIMSSGAVQ